MKIFIAALLIATGAVAGSPAIASADPVDTPCFEDQACWNPATMGNGLGALPPGQVPIPGDHGQA